MSFASVVELVHSKPVILFDLFHTLTSLESTWGDGRRMTWEMLGVSREAWHEQLIEKSRDRLVGEKTDAYQIIADMARAIDPAIPEERIREAMENRVARFAAALRDIPRETVAVLETLKTRHKRLGLISNADVMEVAAWNESPIRRLFDSTILSCAAGCVKPEPEIYELSLRELNASPDQAVFIGDGGSNELQGAKKLGIATIMITGVIQEIWPDRIPERQRHADFVIERLCELIR